MRKILIVDSSTVIINVLKDMFLEKNIFRIYVAKNMTEAQQLLEKHNFFVAISNIVLPDALDGELLELLKVNEVPTIILSSSVDNELITLMDNKCIVDYVLKDSIHGISVVYDLIELLSYIEGIEVLLVEDSLTLSLQLQKILESFLLKVNVARDGLEAIEILNKNPKIDLIITDYNMPKMNGLELLKKIKKEEKYSELPIIVISGENNPDIKVDLLKHGASDFIIKPILEEELKYRIYNIFSKKKQLEEISSFNKIMDDNIISSSADKKGNITHVSDAFCKISGYTKEELIGRNHNILRHPDMPDTIFKELWTTIKSGKKWRGEIKNLTKDGKYYWVYGVIEPTFDRYGKIVGYKSVRHDITDRKRIYELSITDGLTGLYNRRHFNDVAKSIMEETVRNNEVFAFVLLDIDNFKKYNDNYGHQKGDEVLKQVAKSLKETFKRGDDTTYRLGGEEFGILISAKTQEDVISLSKDARYNIEAMGIEHNFNLPSKKVTASFGVAVISTQDLNCDLDYIYKKADDALYRAKDKGRNTIVYSYL